MLECIRCFTCGKFLAGRRKTYEKLVKKYRNDQNLDKEVLISSLTSIDELKKLATTNKTPELRAMEDLHISKMCCRRHLMTDTNILS